MTDIETLNIKPQYIAQKCPVCNGWGTVSFKQITCHACVGKGFILIPVEKEEREKGYGASV
ncbi:MAG: hypothetical protein ACREBJ_06755 [Nitrosotalea sp.]